MATISRITDSKDGITQSLDWERADAKVRELMESGDVEGAREEFGRTLLDSLESGEDVAITPKTWEELSLAFHREGKIAS